MCGDLDEDARLDDEIFGRVLALAGRYGAAPAPDAKPAVVGLAAAGERRAYMDGLFRDTLTRALGDAAAMPEGQRIDAIASQAIVFARLAGYLAGHLPPVADMFRTAVDAMLDGHGEPARVLAERSDHHHGHDHDHDHSHDG